MFSSGCPCSLTLIHNGINVKEEESNLLPAIPNLKQEGEMW